MESGHRHLRDANLGKSDLKSPMSIITLALYILETHTVYSCSNKKPAMYCAWFCEIQPVRWNDVDYISFLFLL